ncbi:MAG: response regulator [Planctomycetes bacterium]|nr:response regulator [Planctomycetota bacterium]
MTVPNWFRRILTHLEIPFEECPLPPTLSAAEPDRRTSGPPAARSWLLSVGGRPLTVVLPASARLDVSRVRAVLGSRDVHLARADEVTAWFKGAAPDAVPPLRLRADQWVMMDRSLATAGKIVMAAGTLDGAVAVRFRDWYRAVGPGVGRFAAENTGRGAEPTILVVEDEEDTNRLVCQLLRQEGFACHGAVAGREALELAAQVRPAAVLLDLMLPDISGFEVYEQLRRSRPMRALPVIIVTALDDEESRQRGRELGADNYLTKPFLPEDLVTEVRSAVADARA